MRGHSKLAIFLLVAWPFFSENVNLSLNPSIEMQYNGDPRINLLNVVRLQSPVELDIEVIVSRETMILLNQHRIQPDTFLGKAFQAAARIFSWHDINLSVRNMEYWSGGNKVTIPSVTEMSRLLLFTSHRPTKYDAILFIHPFSSTTIVGMSFIGTLCSSKAIGMLKPNNYLRDPVSFGDIIAHELGHSMGFLHTDMRHDCKCVHKDKQYCLMFSMINVPYNSTPKSLEDCNVRELIRNLGKYPCLYTKMPGVRLFKTCQDGVIDDDENCDCSFPGYIFDYTLELCKYLNSRGYKCNMKTCKFSDTTCQCAVGTCCKNCMYADIKPCRLAKDKCDITEYCTGTKNTCPMDKFLKNYSPCILSRSQSGVKKTGFCYNGKCSSYNRLCKQAYNKTNMWYSQSCMNYMDLYMKRNCQYYQSQPNYSFMCTMPHDICKHFVCASPDWVPYNSMGYTLQTRVCIIPLPLVRHGLLAHAPDNIQCRKDSHCFNGKCVKNIHALKGAVKKPLTVNKYNLMNTLDKQNGSTKLLIDSSELDNENFGTVYERDKINTIVTEAKVHLYLLLSLLTSVTFVLFVVGFTLRQYRNKRRSIANR